MLEVYLLTYHQSDRVIPDLSAFLELINANLLAQGMFDLTFGCLVTSDIALQIHEFLLMIVKNCLEVLELIVFLMSLLMLKSS